MNVRYHPLYSTWRGIINRCDNPNVRPYRNYGGRGITVCDRWRTFANFVADMGEKPSPTHTVDRIDPNGNYEPANCEWATKTRQARNQRRTTTVTIDGVTYTAPDLAEQSGLSTYAIICRIRKGLKTIEELTAPPYTVSKPYRRSEKFDAWVAEKRSRTHCKRGHEFTEANTYTLPSGQRYCRRCANDARIVARHAAAKKPT